MEMTMEEILVATWHKLKAAIAHIEEALGYVPDTTVVTDDSGGGTPPPDHN